MCKKSVKRLQKAFGHFCQRVVVTQRYVLIFEPLCRFLDIIKAVTNRPKTFEVKGAKVCFGSEFRHIEISHDTKEII